MICYHLLQGWKKERIVQEYPELGSRIIMVMPDDQRYALRKVILAFTAILTSKEIHFPDNVIVPIISK